MERTSLEALLALCLFLKKDQILEDPSASYGIRLEEMNAGELLELIDRAKKRLEELGVPDQGHVLPQRLRISRELRIFLPDRGEEEIRLQPLVKTLFLFFLKHPEGIAFKDLQDYRQELFDLYFRVCQFDDQNCAEEVIDRLVDPWSNSVNTMRTRLSKALSDYFPDDRLVSLYRISGTAGMEKSIVLDRKYVIWE